MKRGREVCEVSHKHNGYQKPNEKIYWRKKRAVEWQLLCEKPSHVRCSTIKVGNYCRTFLSCSKSSFPPRPCLIVLINDFRYLTHQRNPEKKNVLHFGNEEEVLPEILALTDSSITEVWRNLTIHKRKLWITSEAFVILDSTAPKGRKLVETFYQRESSSCDRDLLFQKLYIPSCPKHEANLKEYLTCSGDQFERVQRVKNPFSQWCIGDFWKYWSPVPRTTATRCVHIDKFCRRVGSSVFWISSHRFNRVVCHSPTTPWCIQQDYLQDSPKLVHCWRYVSMIIFHPNLPIAPFQLWKRPCVVRRLELSVIHFFPSFLQNLPFIDCWSNVQECSIQSLYEFGKLICRFVQISAHCHKLDKIEFNGNANDTWPIGLSN